MTEEKIRIDKWLWAARFFKTRSVAAQAVTGGKAQLNGQRVKPSHEVKVGDQIRVTKGLYEHIVDVLQLSGKRGSASQAQLLYQETEDSISKREALAETNRQINKQLESPKKRPDKRQRREIIKLRKN